MLYKKTLSAFFFLFFTLFCSAQEKGLDQIINEKFGTATVWFVNLIFYEIPITDNVGIPWVVVFLLLGASILTFYFKFINITKFVNSINIIRGKYDKIDHHETDLHAKVNIIDGDIIRTIPDESKTGEISHFQALTAALSGTVGLGNIAGVAIAISIGGPGATFWMILAGLLGMTSKFAECTLGVKYRDIDSDGTVYGGPMYYLSKGLKEKNLRKLGKILAIFFAIMCIGGSFGGGNMFQSNQAADIFINTFGIKSNSSGFVFGIVLSIFVGIVILGGIKKIAKVTERIVPFMVGIYIFTAFIILFTNFEYISVAITAIFEGAFSAVGLTGGIIGVLVQGFRRAAFSNEAGVGSAAIAHSAVKTKYPASEGLVALLEPFIDTVVVCTITALVIIIANTGGDIMMYGQKTDGVLATSKAFASVIPWFPYVLTLAVILFAFSTMISWSYYGLQSWLFIFGRNKHNERIYKILFCIFTIVGASITLNTVTDFSDAMIFAMSIPNIIGIFVLLPKIKEELNRYLKAIKNK